MAQHCYNFALLLLHGHGRDVGGRPARGEELEGVVVEGDAVGEVSLQRLDQVQDDAVVRHHLIQDAVVPSARLATEDAREKGVPVVDLV